MAVGLPIGTTRMMRRCRTPQLMVKVSHHGRKWDRWKVVNVGKRGTIRQFQEDPQIEKRRKANQRRAVKASNRERAALSQKEINPNAWYAIIHGIPETPKVEQWKSDRELVKDPRGLIVMKPCRTKKAAEAVGQRAEFGGVRAGVAKGEWLLTDPDTIATVSGYVRYQLFDGQAWEQKRTKLGVYRKAVGWWFGVDAALGVVVQTRLE